MDIRLSSSRESLPDSWEEINDFFYNRGYTDGHHNDVALMTGAPPEGIRLNDVRNTMIQARP